MHNGHGLRSWVPDRCAPHGVRPTPAHRSSLPTGYSNSSLHSGESTLSLPHLGHLTDDCTRHPSHSIACTSKTSSHPSASSKRTCVHTFALLRSPYVPTSTSIVDRNSRTPFQRIERFERERKRRWEARLIIYHPPTGSCWILSDPLAPPRPHSDSQCVFPPRADQTRPIGQLKQVGDSNGASRSQCYKAIALIWRLHALHRVR